MTDLFNQAVVGEIEQGGMDYSTPFAEGTYILKIIGIGEWKADTVKNYQVKQYNFTSRKSEVIETIPELTKYNTAAELEVIEAPAGHEDLVGRTFNHWINVQPNTMFNVKALLAAALGEGIELAPSMFEAALPGAEIKVDLKPVENKGRDKEIQNPDTGISETVEGKIYQSAEIKKFYNK